MARASAATDPTVSLLTTGVYEAPAAGARLDKRPKEGVLSGYDRGSDMWGGDGCLVMDQKRLQHVIPSSVSHITRVRGAQLEAQNLGVLEHDDRGQMALDGGGTVPVFIGLINASKGEGSWHGVEMLACWIAPCWSALRFWPQRTGVLLLRS